MGIRDWFGAKGKGGVRVTGASPEYPTTLAAITSLVDAHAAAGDDGMWLTLSGRGNGRSATIELAGEQLNFCTEEVDLPGLLRSIGCDDLAAAARAGGKKGNDRSLWTIAGASSEQLAMAIDVAFARSLGLGEAYTVEGGRHE